MKRSEFEHAIRAAASILGADELMVIGSQALHATVSTELPEAAQRSAQWPAASKLFGGSP